MYRPLLPSHAGDPKWPPTDRWNDRYIEVIDASAATFAERGYLSATTKDIADRLGIRAASLYYYVKSKDAALALVCEVGIGGFIHQITDIASSPRSAAEKVTAAIAVQLAPLRRRPDADYVRVFLRHRHELPDEPRKRIVDLSRRYQKLVDSIFEAGIASGEFRADLDPAIASFGLIGMCNSVIGARTLPRGATIQAMIDEFGALCVKGTEAPSSITLAQRRKPA